MRSDWPGPIVITWDASLRPVADRILEGRRKELEQMVRALAESDFERIGRLAHDMQGLGLGPVNPIAKELEEDVETGHTEAVAGHIKRLAELLPRLHIRFEDD